MKQMSIRITDDQYQEVIKVMKRLRISRVESIRFLISQGIIREGESSSGRIFHKLAVQSLCLQQRLVASQPDGENLLQDARNDAASLLDQLGL